MRVAIWTAALVFTGAAASADAIDVLRTTGTGPVGNCQSALSVYAGDVRNRPLAVINEGAGTAFITCAYSTEEVSLNLQSFNTNVSNLSAVPASVSCTAVIGDELATAAYVPKSVSLAPGASGQLTWTTADTPGLLITRSIALSCQLPTFTGLNRNRITTLISLL